MTEIDTTGCGDHRARGPFMMTYSGQKFHLLDPRPDEVHIYDVAHHLALQNRYAGATKFPYSVAQHSVLVSRIVPSEYAIYGLLHDAAEAYCQDQIRPMKIAHRDLGDTHHEVIETGIRWAIFDRFGLSEVTWSTIHGIIKFADNVACATEKRDPFPPHPDVDWGPMEAPWPKRLVAQPWQVARRQFLNRFSELMNSTKSPRPRRPDVPLPGGAAVEPAEAV